MYSGTTSGRRAKGLPVAPGRPDSTRSGTPFGAAGRGGSDREPVVAAYLRQIRHMPLLSAHDERRLGWLIRNDGDAAARDEIVGANLRLVVAIARGFTGRGLVDNPQAVRSVDTEACRPAPLPLTAVGRATQGKSRVR